MSHAHQLKSYMKSKAYFTNVDPLQLSCHEGSYFFLLHQTSFADKHKEKLPSAMTSLSKCSPEGVHLGTSVTS